MKDNPQAFPVAVSERTESSFYEEGMTLRDYFAAKALNAFLVNNETNHFGAKSQLAGECYEMADEMLKERNKK